MLGLGLITFTNTVPVSSTIPMIRNNNILRNQETPVKTYKLNWNVKKHRGLKALNSEEELSEKPKENGEDEEEEEDVMKKRWRWRWSELVLDPDPDNVVAVGLTGVLAWASVQVLWQLFAISFAILIAAVKYSFIAALLIFILITLL